MITDAHNHGMQYQKFPNEFNITISITAWIQRWKQHGLTTGHPCKLSNLFIGKPFVGK